MCIRQLTLVCGVMFAIVVGLAQAQNKDDIDFAKARQLLQKSKSGEKLTAEEQAYLDRAIDARKKGTRPQKGPNKSSADVAKDLKPLTEMTADDKYKGQDGGLYGGGKNEPPKEHLDAALRQSALIQPLDAQGKPAKDGKIVLISMGMSNTTQEFSAFERQANGDAQKNPQLVIVDGAQGGMEAQAWAEPDKLQRPNATDPWKVLDERLKQAHVTPQQVQVVWIKQARRLPASLGEFPKHAEEMKGHMTVGLQRLKQTFPNLRLAYLSSRIYAGYATSTLNPEPYAYETAFVTRWLIQDQIRGDASLAYQAEPGPVKAPLLLWGPYLWSQGETGRKLDDLIYKPEDFLSDGTHPSPSGRRKVADQLLHFFKTDPTAKTWFVKK